MQIYNPVSVKNIQTGQKNPNEKFSGACSTSVYCFHKIVHLHGLQDHLQFVVEQVRKCFFLHDLDNNKNLLVKFICLCWSSYMQQFGPSSKRQPHLASPPSHGSAGNAGQWHRPAKNAGKLQKTPFIPHQPPHVDTKPHPWKCSALRLCRSAVCPCPASRSGRVASRSSPPWPSIRLLLPL